MLVGTKRFRQQPVDEHNEPLNAATLRLRAMGALLIAAGVILWLWFY